MAAKSLSVEDFNRNLEATTELVKQLVSDIREGEIDFAEIKTELRILVSNVKELSSLMRDNQEEVADMATKIALLEHSVEELEDWVKNIRNKEEGTNASLQVADRTGKWQTIAAVAAGSLALITAIVTLLVNMIAK